MSLEQLLGSVAVVTAIMTAVAASLIVGTQRLRSLATDWRPRVRDCGPYVLLLAVVLAVSSQVRSAALEVSWLVGIELTNTIYAIEGNLVPWLQTFESSPLTAYFSFHYVYGYVFLLVFPLVAYLALDDREPFRTACLAYAFNYGLGLVLYVLVVAYGPRNLLPSVDSLLYTTWPESQLLTTKVNTNTNVFPSLHSSLATTVVILAYRTRRTYPLWLFVSAGMAASVVVATLYLGIHWGIDGVAGIALAIVSVAAARRYDPVRWAIDRDVARPVWEFLRRVRNVFV